MILTLTLEREEFAAKRRDAQTRYEERLRPAIREALDRGSWAPVLTLILDIYDDAYFEETGDRDAFPPPSGWMQALENTLEKTKGDQSATVDRIALWLAAAVLNVASIQAAQADPETLMLEWVTMHDDDVRTEHRAVDGQARPPGEMFNVGGHDMEYPGDSRAPIHLWINCRCTLRPRLAEEALVASVDETKNKSTVVVGLPAQDHGIHSVGEEQKHVTLAFLGETEAEGVHEAVQRIASDTQPFEASVSGNGSLGPDHAKVLFVEAPEIQGLRNRLMDDPAVSGPVEAADTHPHFVPHMTVTYGDAPAEITEFDSIPIDRLAVWHRDDQTEYPLGGGTVDETDESLAAAGADEVRVPWHGVLAPENVRSGDGRKFAAGALRHRDLPLPLTWQKISDDGHKGNVTVATIEQVEMIDGLMHASGWVLDTAEAAEVVGLIAEFGRFGVSVDADDATFEVDEEAEEVVFTDARVCSACIVPIPAFMEAWVALGFAPSSDSEPPADDVEDPCEKRDPETGECLDAPAEDDEALLAAIEFVDVSPGRTEDGPGWLTHPVDTDRLRDYWTKGPGAAKIGWGSPGDFNRCRMQVGKYVKPQYLNGYCANRHYDALGFWPGRPVNGKALRFDSVAESLDLTNTEPSEAISMTASVGLSAPADWFSQPDLDRPTPITISDTGRVFGHIAEWGTCHIGFSGQCVTPPHSMTDYAYFLTGEVSLDNGTTQRVGNLTIGGGHASPNLGMKPALAHYDSTSAVVADVNVGEDEFGIWFAGWIRPGTSPEMVTAFRASALSGDWRKVGGNLELVAALAVNVPGFGIPRPKVAASAEGQLSLVASGVVPPKKEDQPTKVEAERIADSLAASVAAILEERAARRAQMQALAARITKE